MRVNCQAPNDHDAMRIPAKNGVAVQEEAVVELGTAWASMAWLSLHKLPEHSVSLKGSLPSAGSANSAVNIFL